MVIISHSFQDKHGLVTVHYRDRDVKPLHQGDGSYEVLDWSAGDAGDSIMKRICQCIGWAGTVEVYEGAATIHFPNDTYLEYGNDIGKAIAFLKSVYIHRKK